MTAELQWQNVATDKLNNSVLYLLGVIEEPPWVCSWPGAALLTKQDRAGALSLFLHLPCSRSGRKYDCFISSHYCLCFFIQYGIYFLLEICSSLSLLCSKTGSIQLPIKHFFRDQRQTGCHLCLYPGCPRYHPVPMFSRVTVVILYLHSHGSVLWPDGLQQRWVQHENMRWTCVCGSHDGGPQVFTQV